MYWIANILILGSAGLDAYAVYRQITKTLKCGSSEDVSTSFFGLKVAKNLLGCTALILYQNWAGLALVIPGLILEIVAYIIIIKHKPKSWTPHGIERLLK